MFGWMQRVVSAATGWAPTDDRWYAPIWGGQPTQAGVKINEDIALTYAAVFMCVAKKARTMATLPLHVMEQVSERERKPVDHPLNEIFTTRAAPDTTGLTLRETGQAHIDLWGASYAEIIWSNDRTEPRQLIPLQPRDITPKRAEDGQLVFEHRPMGGEKRTLPADRVFHVPGLSLNGITGLSVIGYNREMLGVGMAATEMTGSFYGNGAWAGGFIQRDPDKVTGGTLSPKKAAEFLVDVNKKHQGAKNAFQISLLREGMTFHQVQIPLVDAQLLESRKYSTIEVCGLFDVPPAKIHRLDEGGKWNNMEEQDAAWAKDSLLPCCRRFENAAQAQLFPPGSKLSLRHNLAGVMRGSFSKQITAFKEGWGMGIWSANDCREMLGLPPIEGGDDHYVPLNMIPIGQARIQQVTTAPADNDGDDKAASVQAPSKAEQLHATVFTPLVQGTASRITTKEVKAVDRALARLQKSGDAEKFTTWLDTFYTDHVGFIEQEMKPLAEAYTAATGREMKTLPADVAEKYAEANHDTLMAVAEDPIKLSGVLDEWKRTKADSLAAGIMRLLEESIETPALIEG